MAAGLGHPAARAVSGSATVLASGVSATEVTNTIVGISVAAVTLVTLVIGIARSNRKNRQLARDERRRLYRRGYLARDRELAQVVSDAAYWRGYALANRKANAPDANPPIVVPAALPPELVPADDEDEDGSEP